MDTLKIFWNDWGNHNLDYYKYYVQIKAITADQYKKITGSDYQAPAASTASVGTSTAASDSTAATSGTANVTPTA
jgi:hypothetical protein